jgi:hypothetical protein
MIPFISEEGTVNQEYKHIDGVSTSAVERKILP